MNKFTKFTRRTRQKKWSAIDAQDKFSTNLFKFANNSWHPYLFPLLLLIKFKGLILRLYSLRVRKVYINETQSYVVDEIKTCRFTVNTAPRKLLHNKFICCTP